MSGYYEHKPGGILPVNELSDANAVRCEECSATFTPEEQEICPIPCNAKHLMHVIRCRYCKKLFLVCTHALEDLEQEKRHKILEDTRAYILEHTSMENMVDPITWVEDSGIASIYEPLAKLLIESDDALACFFLLCVQRKREAGLPCDLSIERELNQFAQKVQDTITQYSQANPLDFTRQNLEMAIRPMVPDLLRNGNFIMEQHENPLMLTTSFRLVFNDPKTGKKYGKIFSIPMRRML